MSRPTVGTSRLCPHSREIWYLSLRAETKKAWASKYTTLGVKDSFKVFFRKPYVIFMGFKNEPHTRHSGLFWPLTWNCIYLHIRQKNPGKGSTHTEAAARLIKFAVEANSHSSLADVEPFLLADYKPVAMRMRIRAPTHFCCSHTQVAPYPAPSLRQACRTCSSI